MVRLGLECMHQFPSTSPDGPPSFHPAGRPLPAMNWCDSSNHDGRAVKKRHTSRTKNKSRAPGALRKS